MAAGKEIRTKISSVRNTQKITSAMEMVAASKMQRTQQKMREGRPYANKIRQVIGHLAASATEYKHKYMQETPISRIGYLVITTDKGLCGGLNINLLRDLFRDVQKWNNQSVESDFGLVGRKAHAFFSVSGGNVLCALDNSSENPSAAELIGSVKVMLNAFSENKINRLYLASNKFVNTMTQKPRIQQLLPLPIEEADMKKQHWDYIYEPEAKDLIGDLITRYIESQVYQAVIENIACEQAAKMIAMKSATENAGDIIDDLQLLYNNIRQAAITQEISEIIGGSAAV